MTHLHTLSDNEPHVLPLRLCDDVALVGGKAANLGELIRAGFAVPDGFVVTTAAFRAARAAGASEHGRLSVPASVPHELAAEIVRQYELLGGEAVAVRSSATAEDMAGASMAGQYDTFLDVRDEGRLLERVRQCWESLDSPRTRAYLAEQGIDITRVAMAVVVQKLVPADVAGVLFTVNARSGDEDQMLIEASWGLGESVVSGEVQPDTLTLAREDGRVLEAVIAEKRAQVDPATGRETEVAEGQRKRACLKSRDVHALWQVGLRAQAHFGRPQDLEWAIAGGRLYVLQSRAVTTIEPLRQRRRALAEAAAQVRAMVAQGRGPWVPHNISETLPHPTPLTWSVISHFLSGDGGFGEMYRAVGFEPGPRVRQEGFVDRIGGRIYMDLSRGPEMFFADFPYAYDPALLRGNPEAGQSPPTLPRGSATARYQVGRKLAAVHARTETLAQTLDRRLQQDVIPYFEQWVEQQRATDLAGLSERQLVELWDERRRRVMDEFAPQSLLPSLIVGQVQADLATLIGEHVWDQDPTKLARDLSSLGEADRTIVANQMLYEVGTGKTEIGEWLKAYGHRAPDELDLSTPRWRERPEDVRRLAAQLAAGADPHQRHSEQKAAVEAQAESLRRRLPAAARVRFDALLDLLRRYVPYRENAKYFLMLGYERLRDVALEAGRRLEIGDGVFFLTQEEFKTALVEGYAPIGVIEHRRAAHAAQRRLDLPALIDADWAEQAERPAGAAPVTTGADAQSWRGFAISPGVGRGVPCIVEDPTTAQTPERGYVLVCRTTDPSWTPLFVNASGIVLETGGSLSHGAIVAREMGVPAVVVPQARRLLAGVGEVVVDGDRGRVALAGAASDEHAGVDATDTTVPPSMMPPPASAKGRAAAAWRDRAVIFWIAFLGLLFLLPPAWIHEPVMRGLDALLWPMMRSAGPVYGTALLAAALALVTMLGQRVLTDNHRLRIAKDKAKPLRGEAESLPAGSPRRKALSAVAGGVQKRVVGAAMVPVGLLLGPLVLIFLWLPMRVDPAVTPPPVGARIIVKATVAGDHTEPVTLVPGGMTLGSSPAEQTIPPIRAALLALREEWTGAAPGGDAPLPWDVLAAGRMARQQLLAELHAFLLGPMPPQPLAWETLAPAEAGVYEMRLETADAPPVVFHVAIGERSLPQAKSADGNPQAVQSIEVVYPPKREQDLFFARPFARFGWHWDIGWLGVYLAAYLPAMFVARAALRVA